MVSGSNDQLRFALHDHERSPEKSALWFSAQQPRQAQRNHGRYVEESFAHLGKMLPSLVRSMLDTYGQPGDRWCDPMCGIGTTLVEGVDRGYEMYGVEYESRWAGVTQQNIDLARLRQAPGRAYVKQGDARHLTEVFADISYDKVAFSPPYGNTLSKTSHGPDLHPERQQGGKRAAKAIRHGYSFAGTEEAPIPDSAEEMALGREHHEVNIGDLKHGQVGDAVQVARTLAMGLGSPDVKPSYLSEMAKIYHQCYLALKPGGMMLLVLRDYRRNNRRVDLLGDTLDICEALGFVYHDRIAALQCPVEGIGGSVRAKPEGAIAFWTVENSKRSDPPWLIPVFEDILVLRKDEPRKRR